MTNSTKDSGHKKTSPKTKSSPPKRLVSKIIGNHSPISGSGFNPISLSKVDDAVRTGESRVHHYGEDSRRCNTDLRGQKHPGGRSPTEIVVDASEGFIPLWEEDSTLKWRFDEQSMQYFQNPDAAKAYIQRLMADALSLWGVAAPVRFTYSDQPWDFEVSYTGRDDCRGGGCVLASAFFPNGGQNGLILYPKLFEQNYQEQVETMAHEFGHVFGLRHFFANVSENEWPSEIYGDHNAFSIMNYGADSYMTTADQSDLANLYREVWNGVRKQINGTPIRLFKPYSFRANVDCVCD